MDFIEALSCVQFEVSVGFQSDQIEIVHVFCGAL